MSQDTPSPFSGISRRAFLKTGLTLSAFPLVRTFGAEKTPGSGIDPLSAMAPEANKHLSPEWVASLFARGEPSVWKTPEERRYLGIPAGGIGSGTVYLGADGKLWVWDIFNVHHEGVVPNRTNGPEADSRDNNGVAKISERNGANYVSPPSGNSPWNLDNGFTLRFADGTSRTLDAEGFRDITCKGQYPAPTYTYADEKSPVSATLGAISPFIPLEYDDSSLPVVFLSWTLKNTGATAVDLSLEGRLENGSVKLHTDHPAIRRRIRPVKTSGAVLQIGEVVSADGSRAPQGTLDRSDFGSVALAVIGEGSATPEKISGMTEKQLLVVNSAKLSLAPGESKTVVFVIGWHFPHSAGRISHGRAALPDGRRWVAGRFADAGELVAHAVKNADQLVSKTRLFRDTWYGSESGDNRGTLPHWLLERALWTATTLTTNGSYRLVDDRFWAWEGTGACEGTCTHVWHYAQAQGRLFPALEKSLRVNTDFKAPAMADNGAIDFRGGMAGGWAIDGQAGTILRSWRNHCTDTSGEFLKTNWDSIKKAARFLIAFDAGKKGKPDGVPTGSAHNTLDANWSGAVPWFVSLYNASLVAAAAMADETGDKAFATECRDIIAQGRAGYAKLFNAKDGFYQANATEKEMLPIHVGKGCHIDMALGDWWLAQTGLPAFGDKTQLRAAMDSLFRHNFVPNMGPFRRRWKTPSQRGRPYALEGESGLVMCTWPKNGLPDACRNFWSFGYFQECMTGFEYSAAGLMVSLAENERDPLLMQGLAVTRAVHDRYAGNKRNPYNEIECSDHYARAMASYGVFIAACGFHTHAPSGLIRFEPKWHTADFAAPFTGADGWGRYAQTQKAGSEFSASLALRHGTLKLATLEVAPGITGELKGALKIAGKDVAVRVAREGVRAIVRLGEPVVIREGESAELTLLRA